MGFVVAVGGVRNMKNYRGNPAEALLCWISESKIFYRKIFEKIPASEVFAVGSFCCQRFS